MNTMRRELLRQFIEANGIVTIKQLTELTPNVTLMTIHRDLSYLQEQGVIEKVRGGARYIAGMENEAAFAVRETVAKDAKAIIAEKAVELFPDAGSIFIDAGTTMMAFARALPDRRVNIVTTGPNIALEIAARQGPELTICGGMLNKSNLTLSGTAALDTISNLNIDTAFLVPSGFSAEAGFTCGLESESRIKQLVISKARTVIMLMDTSKIERVLPYTFAYLADIEILVTEESPAELPRMLLEQASHIIIL